MHILRPWMLLTCLAIFGFAAIGPAVQPSWAGDAGAAWEEGEPFAGKKKTRKSISGAACAPSRPPVCIAALDEGRTTQFFTYANGRIIPDAVMRLLAEREGGTEFGEIDAEGAAYSDGSFYLTGSHGLSRKKATVNASSFFVFRFPADRKTGIPPFAVSAKTVAPEIARTDRLREAISTAPGLIGEYAEKPLGKKHGGANIEGLAVIGHRIFFGFRGPSKKGKAYIMDVDVEGLFSGGELDRRIHKVELGKNTGIRDLAAVSGGLLILSGPVQNKGGYAIHHLDLRETKPKLLQALKMPKKGAKAETLLVLGETDKGFDVLVMYDGIADGGPREFRLSR
jgi:hypothetical protein